MRYIVLGILLLIVASCVDSQQQSAQLAQAHCVARDGLPDHQCTSGATFASATTAQVCKPGYASSVRNVPQAEKDKVYAEYGVPKHLPGEYEVDHLVSLEIGGSNDITNLWPEPYTGPYNAHMKDKVENYLHGQVCSGDITLREAQIEIAANWKDIALR